MVGRRGSGLYVCPMVLSIVNYGDSDLFVSS